MPCIFHALKYCAKQDKARHEQHSKTYSYAYARNKRAQRRQNGNWVPCARKTHLFTSAAAAGTSPAHIWEIISLPPRTSRMQMKSVYMGFWCARMFSLRVLFTPTALSLQQQVKGSTRRQVVRLCWLARCHHPAAIDAGLSLFLFFSCSSAWGDSSYSYLCTYT